jgi:hypothetical protein
MFEKKSYEKMKDRPQADLIVDNQTKRDFDKIVDTYAQSVDQFSFEVLNQELTFKDTKLGIVYTNTFALKNELAYNQLCYLIDSITHAMIYSIARDYKIKDMALSVIELDKMTLKMDHHRISSITALREIIGRQYSYFEFALQVTLVLQPKRGSFANEKTQEDKAE